MKLWIKAIFIGIISQLIPIGIITFGAGLENYFHSLATPLELLTPILWIIAMVFYPFSFFLLPEEGFSLYPNYEPSFIERHSWLTFVMNLLLYISLSYTFLYLKAQRASATKRIKI